MVYKNLIRYLPNFLTRKDDETILKTISNLDNEVTRMVLRVERVRYPIVTFF